MAEVIHLTGTDEARGWLELARSAEKLEDVVAFLGLHASLMRKTKVTRTPARESRASAQVRQHAKASRG